MTTTHTQTLASHGTEVSQQAKCRGDVWCGKVVGWSITPAFVFKVHRSTFCFCMDQLHLYHPELRPARAAVRFDEEKIIGI
jgi:hypothetical protein